MKLLNAFSLNMLFIQSVGVQRSVFVAKMDLEQVKNWLSEGNCESYIGHADTAAVVGAELGFPVKMRRETITLIPGETCVIAQYVGPRLPEGATKLPEGSRLEWFSVRIG